MSYFKTFKLFYQKNAHCTRRRKLAARLGFEPRYIAPEATVLPLDDLAMIYTLRYFLMAIKLEMVPKKIPVAI